MNRFVGKTDPRVFTEVNWHCCGTSRVAPLAAMLSATHCSKSSRILRTGDRTRFKQTSPQSARNCCRHALDDSKRIGVFVSGGGSNFKAIHQSCISGKIKGSIVVRFGTSCILELCCQQSQLLQSGITNATSQVVVTDLPTCGGAEYANSHGIDVLAFPAKGAMVPAGSATVMKSAEDLAAALSEVYKLDYVLLAGYLKLVPPAVVQAFSRRMLNIHPGLLPAFGGKGMYGMNVHKTVIASGSRYTGPTVHFVDEHYDTGPILAQRVVPCYPHDTAKTLAARVLKQEHELYPQVVEALCDDRVAWRDDGIPYIWAAL